MKIKSLIGLCCVGLSTSALSNIESTINEPVFEHEKLLKKHTKNYQTDTPLELTAAQFDTNNLVYGYAFVRAGLRLVNYTNNAVSIINIGEDNSLALQEQFSRNELNLFDFSILGAALNQDGSILHLLVHNNNYQSRTTDVITYQITDEGLTQLSRLNGIFNDYYHYGNSIFKFTDDWQSLVVYNEYANQIKLLDVDASDSSLSMSSTIETGGYDVEFFNLDTANNILTFVFEGNYYSSHDCVETRQLNDNGETSIIESIACNSEQLPSYLYNTSISMSQNDLFIASNSEITLMNISSTGQINLLSHSNTADAFGGNNLYSPIISNGRIVANNGGYPSSYNVYTYDDSGNFTEVSSIPASELTGSNYGNNLFSLTGSSFIVGANGTNAYSMVELTNSDTLVGGTVNDFGANNIVEELDGFLIPVGDEHFVAIDYRSLIVADASSSKNFKQTQTLSLTTSIDNDAKFKKLNENTYFVYSRYGFLIFAFDQENHEVSVIENGQYLDGLGNNIYLNNNSLIDLVEAEQATYLVGKSQNDRLAIFELNENSLEFREYVVDFVNDIEGIQQTTSLVSLNNHLYLMQSDFNRIARLTINDDSTNYEPNAFASFNLNYYYYRTIKLNDQFMLFSNNLAYSFGEREGELELLTVSTLKNNFNQLIEIDKRHLMTIYGNTFDIYQIEPKSGGLIYADAIEFRNESLPMESVYRLYFSENSLWYFGSGYIRQFGKLALNRAPVWRSAAETLSLNEGAATTFEIDNFIQDLDNDALTFAESNIPASFVLNQELALLEFDGSIETFDSLVMSGADETLSSMFTFDLMFNYAPSLLESTPTQLANQGETLAIDLHSLFEDSENNHFSIVLSQPVEQLEMLANGTLTGHFTSHGNIDIEVVATDEFGATKTSTITMEVNGQPTLAGSSRIDAKVGEQLNINLNEVFNDPEGDSLAFSVEGLPQGISLASNTLSGSPTATGTFGAVLVATDEKGASARASVTFSITQDSGGGGAMSIVLLLAGLGLVRRRSTH